MNIEQAEKRVEKILANADRMIWNQLPLSREDYEAINIINSNYKAMADIIYSQQKEIDFLKQYKMDIQQIQIDRTEYELDR